ncbi:BZZ1_1 [Sanghuangporus vaninii]
MIDMQNSKNVFLTSTAVANRVKNRFYSEDLPLIENDFRKANLITGLTSILLQAQQLHTSHLDTLKSRVNTAREALEGVKPSLDQDLYINYNARPFSIPNDWDWEPCAGHYDTGEMMVEPEPKVVLQNKLSRCREKLEEINGLVNAQRKDADKLSNVLSTYMNDRNLDPVDDIMNDYLGIQYQLTLLELTATILNAEIETISDALGASNPRLSPFQQHADIARCGALVLWLNRRKVATDDVNIGEFICNLDCPYTASAADIEDTTLPIRRGTQDLFQGPYPELVAVDHVHQLVEVLFTLKSRIQSVFNHIDTKK